MKGIFSKPISRKDYRFISMIENLSLLKLSTFSASVKEQKRALYFYKQPNKNRWAMNKKKTIIIQSL